MIIAKGTAAANELAERAQRIIGLEDRESDVKLQVKNLREQIAEEYADAKSTGFSDKALRTCVKELRLDDEERQARFDFEQEVDQYRNALGILPPSQAGEFAARDIVEAMSASERSEASLRIAAGEDAKTAVTKAVLKRGRSSKDDKVTTTVSINGGAAVPLETLQRAVRRVKPGARSVIAALGDAVNEESAEAAE